MKIAFLTTDTTHHIWYLQELVKNYCDIICIYEDDIIIPEFEVSHPFEYKRECYEQDYFFSNKEIKFNDLCESINVKNINQVEVVEHLESFFPDIIISFGTRKIKDPLVSKFFGKIINLHGGDPGYYRGLDSHLWAIYHNDWDNIATTLHILNAELDDGEVIQKKHLDISILTDLFKLRSLNTEACLDLTISSLKSYENLGFFLKSKQIIKGRYYSFMPSCLKKICVDKFNDYVGSK